MNTAKLRFNHFNITPRKTLIKKSQGVTLFELSIVLVIIGIIISGAYISYDYFINRAKITKTMIEMKDYRKGFESFHSVYGAFPGDITSASRRIDSTMIDGNGDGKIASESEQNAFWPHMSYSKMISHPSGGRYENVATNVNPKVGVNLPRLQDSDDIAIGVVYNTPSGVRANSYILGGLDGKAVTLPRFSVTEAQIMDQKFDDNNPASGGIMCGKNVQSGTILVCSYSNMTAQSDANIFIPFTPQTTDASNSCPAQSLQISQQLVANVPSIAANATATYNCRDINPSYTGTYTVACNQSKDSNNNVVGYTIATTSTSCSLKSCAVPNVSSISGAASVQSTAVLSGQYLSYTCNSGMYATKSLCSPNLTTDAASLNPAPACTSSPTGVAGNIPIYAPDAQTLKDSGRSFNDNGTSVYDILSGSKIYVLLGSTTTSQNYLTKYSTQNAGILPSSIFDNGTSIGVGTATPSSSAILDLTSTTQGFLPPRMTTAQMNAILNPTLGMVVYNTTAKMLYFHSGTSWSAVSSGGSGGTSYWVDSTDTVANPSTSGSAMSAGDVSVNGMLIGRGFGNVATNTAVGASALQANSSGANNVAVGSTALMANTDGSQNTAVGGNAGSSITTGSNNTVIGYDSQTETAGTSNSITLGNEAISKFRIPALSINALLKQLFVGVNPSAVVFSGIPAVLIGDSGTGITNSNTTGVSGLTNTLDFYINGVKKMYLDANGTLNIDNLSPNQLTVGAGGLTTTTLTASGTSTLTSVTSSSITNSGTLTVGGASTLTGLLTANGGLTTTDATVTGTLTTTGAFSPANLSTTGTLTVGGASTLTGMLNANGGLTTTDATITGTLSVPGAFSPANLSTPGTLNVTGLSTLTGGVQFGTTAPATPAVGMVYYNTDQRSLLMYSQDFVGVGGWFKVLTHKDVLAFRITGIKLTSFTAGTSYAVTPSNYVTSATMRGAKGSEYDSMYAIDVKLKIAMKTPIVTVSWCTLSEPSTNTTTQSNWAANNEVTNGNEFILGLPGLSAGKTVFSIYFRGVNEDALSACINVVVVDAEP